MIAYTSRLAYRTIRNYLGERQWEVYRLISNNQPITNDKIAELLGWEINRVTGRVNELVKMGYVEQVGYGVTKSGRRAKTWAAKNTTDTNKQIATAVAIDDRRELKQSSMFNLAIHE